MASKKFGKGKKDKKTPPPKVEKKGKVTKVKFTSEEQRDEVLAEAEANEHTTFHLTPEEIAERKKQHEQEYKRLLGRRLKLHSLEMARDAVKAELKATELGQKLERLKEDCKAEEIIIAALQNKVETLGIEANTGRTAEYQKPLSFDDDGDGDDKPGKMQQADLPLGPPPPPAGAAAPAPETPTPPERAITPEDEAILLTWLAERKEPQGTHLIVLGTGIHQRDAVRALRKLADEGLVRFEPWAKLEPHEAPDLREGAWSLTRALVPALPAGPGTVIDGTFEDAPALGAAPPRGLLPAATATPATTAPSEAAGSAEPGAEARTATTAKPNPETLENAGRVLALLRQRGKSVATWDVMRQIDLSVEEARDVLGLLLDRNAVQSDGSVESGVTLWSLVQAEEASPDDEPEPPPPTVSKPSRKLAHRDTKPAKGQAPKRAAGAGARAQHASEELFERTTTETWRSALDQEVRLFVARRGNPVDQATLIAHGPAPAALELACRKLLADADAIRATSGGNWEPGAAVADESIAADIQRLVDDWVHDLIEHAPGIPRVSDLAALTELPRSLLLAVCERLHKARRIEWGDGLTDPKLFALVPAKKAAE